MSWKHVRCALAFTILGSVAAGALYFAIFLFPQMFIALGASCILTWALYTAVTCLKDRFG